MKNQENPQPPRWADQLLEWFVAAHLLEYVQGDLHETFQKQVAKVGAARARREYIWAVLHCLTPFFAKRKTEKPAFQFEHSKPRFTDMLSNYLNIAFRNLWRHKGFTAINIVGLATGLATCLLIVVFVLHELSYDRYHTNADRMYRMTLATRLGDKDFHFAYTSEPAGPALLRDCAGVEAVTQIRYDGGYLVKNGRDVYKEEKIAFVNPNFFSFFSLPIVKGSRTNALVEPRTLVLTEKASKKYFGNVDPVGKTLSVGSLGIFQVKGVCADVPSNTHFQFEMFGSIKSVNPGTKWLASGAHTYFTLRQGYSIAQVEKQTESFATKYLAPEIQEFFGVDLNDFLKKGSSISFAFQPVTDIHLRSDLLNELEANSDIKYVYIFSIIAAFILILACVNFMNLTTAGSAGRSKEIGVRKVLGSVQNQLIKQFLTESSVLTFLALLFALGLVILLLPGFNQLAGKQFTWMDIFNVRILPGTLAACLLIGLLAGSYPAFVLSSFKPITALSGKIQSGLRTGLLRNTLVTGQFVVSIGIIIATIVTNQQLRFMQNKKVGFDREQVLILHDTQVLGPKLDAFKASIRGLSPVSSVTLAGFLPVGVSSKSQDGVIVRDGSRVTTHLTKSYYIDEDYLPTLGISLVQGRSFSKTFPADRSEVLINESAARAYGFKDPIGKQFSITGNGSEESQKTFTIIGVVKDFHFESMRQRIAPLIMFYGGDNGQLALRIHTSDIPGLLKTIEKHWKAETDNPFVYSFLNERFNTMYEAEQQIGQLFGVFAGLAILISCLGLFGLAALTTHQRTKEIGVRKVLGASVASVVTLLLTNYLKLIVIALFIASPIAGYAMSQWLADFAYKINVSWWIFVLAGLLAICVALLTVGFHSIRASLMNPVKSLRSE